MKFLVATTFLMFVHLLTGCTVYPKSSEDQATYHVNEAKSAMSKGHSTDAANEIDDALDRPTGDQKIREFFTNTPKAKDYYVIYLEKLIADVSSADKAIATFKKLSNVKSARIFPDDQIQEFFKDLAKNVSIGNTIGSVPFILGDKIDHFPELKSPAHQKIIVNRSIKVYQGSIRSNRAVPDLMEYVQRLGVDSAEGKRIESLLPTINISRDELNVVAKVFPNFAKARQEEITARIFLQLKNADRFLREDLLQTLRSGVRGVEWVPSAGPNTIILMIERLRNDEKTLPERMQTITYAQHEVNLLSAAFLMPKNASFLYDVVSGGAEIEYGYVITAIENNKPIFEELVRGKVGGEYRSCQNSRIQNVFGGVSPANFVANYEMQHKCAGPSSISIDELRKEVLLKVVDGVLNVPRVRAIHELN